jgi:hypothetical protein
MPHRRTPRFSVLQSPQPPADSPTGDLAAVLPYLEVNGTPNLCYVNVPERVALASGKAVWGWRCVPELGGLVESQSGHCVWESPEGVRWEITPLMWIGGNGEAGIVRHASKFIPDDTVRERYESNPQMGLIQRYRPCRNQPRIQKLCELLEREYTAWAVNKDAEAHRYWNGRVNAIANTYGFQVEPFARLRPEGDNPALDSTGILRAKPVRHSPETWAEDRRCWANVAKKVVLSGGSAVGGFLLTAPITPGLEAIKLVAHCVWESPDGELIDVTPHGLEEVSFFADPAATTIPVAYAPLNGLPTTSQMIRQELAEDDIEREEHMKAHNRRTTAVKSAMNK